MTNNSIQPVPDRPPDQEWAMIVERIVDEVTADSGVPQNVIRAVEYMLAGVPTNEIAKKLKVTTGTVRGWLKAYPSAAMAVAQGRKLLSVWRMAQIEKQFVDALDVSQKILQIGMDGVMQDGTEANAKIVGVLGLHSRWLIDRVLGGTIKIQVEHQFGDTVLQAKEEALQYLLQNMDTTGPVEAVVRVIDGSESGPVLDQNGEPFYGDFGVLSKTDDGFQCHICGSRFVDLARHVHGKHDLDKETYEITFMLDAGALSKDFHDEE